MIEVRSRPKTGRGRKSFGPCEKQSRPKSSVRACRIEK
nr:MAG TPA: hypothetical protein [Caudoviricetes sp.]